jgi:hypothetical protein
MNDILLNTDLDLDFVNGDLVIGDATKQNQQLLVISSKGDWKENPTIGVGAAGYLKDEDEAGLMAEIKTQFEKDGMKVLAIKVSNENIEVSASY